MVAAVNELVYSASQNRCTLNIANNDRSPLTQI